jgi:GNAT superfamily N-acetyltransferase
VREARADDVPPIAPWTTDTFAWGDYVADRLGDWIADPDLHVIVCELEDGTPVAVMRAQMLSPTEGWLDAARVHPDHRRSGLGSAMNHTGVAWAARRGARVTRLAVETDHESVLQQVLGLGYRETCRWIYGRHECTGSDRIPEQERLENTFTADLDAAWMFWSNSELALAGHELVPIGWLWRRMMIDDLSQAISRLEMYQSPSGWLLAKETEAGLSVNFMVTAPADAPQMLRAIGDLALEMAQTQELDKTFVEIKLPALSWTAEALQRAGFTTKELAVFSKLV